MGAVAFFEELRFIIELLAAEHLFAYVFAKQQDNFRMRVSCSFVIMMGISCIYPFLAEQFHLLMPGILVNIINVGWYTLLAVGSGLCIKFCYKLTTADTMFLCAAGYSLQHIEYVAVNEILAKGVWQRLSDMLPLYVLLCAVSASLLYYVVYRLFVRPLGGQGGRLFEDCVHDIAFTVLMNVLVLFSTFMCQTIFVSGRQDYKEINYLGAVTDLLMCILILWVLYAICRIHGLNKEKDIVEQILYERKRQYEMSRENIETINHKCHDLKHQLRALQQVSADERGQYIEELERAISIYDKVTETGNEVVNTILSEKSLYCERRQIKLSCIVDASHLDFMSTLDIYAILGNALDNAIENVSKYNDAGKRVISLTIKTVGDFLSIQTNNYCEEKIEICDGLPVTTKRDKTHHGFGMKSMRHLAGKYGGSLAVSARDNVFTLQILLPMPKEFLRLYKLERQ